MRSASYEEIQIATYQVLVTFHLWFCDYLDTWKFFDLPSDLGGRCVVVHWVITLINIHIIIVVGILGLG